MYRVAVAAILIILGALMVCGSRGLAEPYADRRHQVELSGVVYYRGERQEGSIEFVPQLLQPEYHPMHVRSLLTRGEFHIPRDIGPEPGLFLIHVSCGKESSPKASGMDRKVVTGDEDGIVRATLDNDIVVRVTSQRRQRFEIWLE
jgi:hypothetical protein